MYSPKLRCRVLHKPPIRGPRMASAGLHAACRSLHLVAAHEDAGRRIAPASNERVRCYVLLWLGRAKMTQMPHHRGAPNAIELLIVPSDVRSENTPSIRFSATPGKEPTVELGLE